MRQVLYFLGAVLMCWATAVGADKSATAPPAAKGPRPLYDLQFRPAVGLRVSYESSTDSEIHFRAAANGANRSAESGGKSHTQVVVTSEEITELNSDHQPVARRVTFGPNCFTASQEDKQPTRKIRLVYAGKTVNFRLNPETDQIDQDFGVRPRPEEMRRLRNVMKGTTLLFAGHPVAVGDRWRADEGLRALANLRESDIISSIVTLKAIRDGENGAKIADLGVTSGVITSERGMHAEISFEGTVSVDVKSGVVVASDLKGELNIAGGLGEVTRGRGGPPVAAALSLTGNGQIEMHVRGRILPPASATQPAGNSNIATTDGGH